jgi:hypothetical protein
VDVGLGHVPLVVDAGGVGGLDECHDGVTVESRACVVY